MKIFFLWLCCLPVLAGPADTYQLTIHFENIKHQEGTLLLGFYEDERSWNKRRPAFEKIVKKSGLKDGKITVTLDQLYARRYGIAVLDDANNNNKVDFGLIFPEEGFGFSNYYHSSFLPPQYRDFQFVFPTTSRVTVRMRYLD